MTADATDRTGTTLFGHIFSRPHQLPGEEHHPTSFEGQGCWWDDPQAIPLGAGRGFNIRAVGESRFQSEIGSIVGGRCQEGHNCQFPAELVFAATEHDANAIAIRIGGVPVGFLPSDCAEQVRPLLAALGDSQKAVTCKAKIVGGWDKGKRDQGYFGVRLSLSLPPKVHPRAGRT